MPAVLAALAVAAEALSAWHPADPMTWLPETVWVPAGLPLLVVLRRRFPMLEWAAAVTGGHAADAFLATQGDEWDTQGDRCCALVGASLALLLSRAHDRRLARLAPPARPEAGTG
ncbi:DUF2238 domain-containing protein [Streptomyces sp. NPDC047097]|uniref:DUF2238 domain-containing protein n=1 Tax=Streptomyces sp. NPDC047097 TaxID=3155260 RepID=UPI0033EB740A